MCYLYTIRDKAKCVTWPSRCYLFSFMIASATHVLQQLLLFMPFSKARTCGVSLTVTDLQSAPFAARCTDPCIPPLFLGGYDYGHHTGVIINVWWPLAEVNNQPRVVTRNTSVSHLYRRNGGIRTRDPLLPKQVRYQAAPHSVFSLLCCRFTLWASDHLCSVFSKDSGPKSKPDAVSHWKGDFQWVRYLSVCPVQERG